MKRSLENFIAELKSKGNNPYSTHENPDPEAKINVWYVVAKLEEILLLSDQEKS